MCQCPHLLSQVLLPQPVTYVSGVQKRGSGQPPEPPFCLHSFSLRQGWALPGYDPFASLRVTNPCP